MNFSIIGQGDIMRDEIIYDEDMEPDVLTKGGFAKRVQDVTAEHIRLGYEPSIARRRAQIIVEFERGVKQLYMKKVH